MSFQKDKISSKLSPLFRELKKREIYTPSFLKSLEEILKKEINFNDIFTIHIDYLDEGITLLTKNRDIYIKDIDDTFSILLEVIHKKKSYFVKNIFNSFLYNKKIDKLSDFNPKAILALPILDKDKRVTLILYFASRDKNGIKYLESRLDTLNSIVKLIEELLLSTHLEQSSKQDDAKESSNSNKEPSILIVDDEGVIVKFLSIVLSQQGFATQKAYSGEEAISKYKSSDFDLIIIDEIMHSGLNGHQAIKEIRELQKRENRRYIPIIGITSDTKVSTKVLLLKSGANLVLHKPLKPKIILDNIKKLIANY